MGSRVSSVTVKMTGARELRRKLNRIDRELAGAGMKKIHKDVAEAVLPTARTMTPVRSGRLRSDIRTGATTRTAELKVGRASVPYAGPIHFGWPTRPNPERGWWGGPIRANRFLYRAIDTEVRKIISTYEEGLADLLDRIWSAN